MKKISFVVAALILIFISCNKDKDEVSYQKSELIGLWEQTNPAPEDEMCTDYSSKVRFEEDTISFISSCDGFDSRYFMPYEFDGKTVSYVFLLTMNMEIVELTSTKLVTKEFVTGIDVSETKTYTKVTE